MLANALSLHLPEFAATTLQRIGQAALRLGPMAAGAGLRLGAPREGLGAALLGIRHLVLPAATVPVLWLNLPLAQQAVIAAFAALPTTPSRYDWPCAWVGTVPTWPASSRCRPCLRCRLPLAWAALSALR